MQRSQSSDPARERFSFSWESPDSSSEEQIFFGEILPLWLNQRDLAYVHPQAPLAALVEAANPLASSRVDFAYLHPRNLGAAIVIEIDGEQHELRESQENDRDRDSALTSAGHMVVRIPASEIRRGQGPALEKARKALDRSEADPIPSDPRALAAIQVCVALVEIIEEGILPVGADKWSLGFAGPETASLEVGFRCFVALITALEDLYQTRILPQEIRVLRADELAAGDLVIDWRDSVPWFADHVPQAPSGANLVSIRPAWLPLLPPLPPPPREWVAPNPQVASEALNTLLRFISPDKKGFWPGQEEALRRCLAGKDSLVLLPTGGGKSLVYQMAAVLLPGMTLVIAPLVALMEDQLDNLRRSGFDRVSTISSSTTRAGETGKLQELLRAGIHFLCYISPERMQIQEFRDALESARAAMPIPLIVIDEAHCVSEWGHDFRPAYLNIARIGRSLGRRGPGEPPSLVGLTGTASRAVLRDLQSELGIPELDAVITPETFDRPELSFEVIEGASASKPNILEGVLRAIPQRIGVPHSQLYQVDNGKASCGIVFCPHVRGDFGVEHVSELLSRKLGIPVPNYSGSLEGGQKTLVATAFKDDEFPLMVATKAFGMGIDKPNIRYTVHYSLPPSLEAFYQEAGRAGRARDRSHCTLIASVDNSTQAGRLLDPSLPAVDLNNLYRKIDRENRDDITRNLYFHTDSFKGIPNEIDQVRSLLTKLGNLEVAGSDVISYSSDKEQKQTEKALHRLIILGLVSDYTVDFSRKQIKLTRHGASKDHVRERLAKYVGSYSKSRSANLLREIPDIEGQDLKAQVLSYVEHLIRFIYETIEASRRAGIREVWRWASSSASSEELRRRLLDYLQETEFSKEAMEILRTDEHNLESWGNLLDQISSRRDLEEIDAAMARASEDYPDHPAVLAVRAVLSATKSSDSEAAEFAAGCAEFLHSRYSGEPTLQSSYAQWVLDRASAVQSKALPAIVRAFVEKDDGSLTRTIIASDLPIEARFSAVPQMLDLITTKAQPIIDKWAN